MNRVLTPTGALRAWWSVMVVLVTAVAIMLAGFVYTSHVQHQMEQRWREQQRQSDHRWCDLLTTLDQPGQPAPTERARRAQQQFHQLRLELCGGQ